MSVNRRSAMQALAGLSATALLRAQEAPMAELVNAFEVLVMARRKLPETVYANISGTDRRALERITFRPRLMVDTTKLDLTTELLGEKLFTPVIVGPISQQQAFHPEGEVAMVRGASAAKTLMIVSCRSSRPLAEIAAEAKTPLWFQIYPDTDVKIAQQAVQAGCKALCLTLPGIDWARIDQIRASVKVPLVLKGIMSPEEARLAVSRGIAAIVVSNHGGLNGTGFADPIEMLPSVADAVGGKIPILIDGSFRRGSDVLKALALGARAVLFARAPVWGLAAYGSEGVQFVLEMIQTELARNMAMCGKVDIRSLDRTLVKVHSRSGRG